MFKITDMYGNIYDAYGAFVDEDGDIQFILCNSDGVFYATNNVDGWFKLYQ